MSNPVIIPGARVVIQDPDAQTPTEIEATVEFGSPTRFRCRADDGRVYWSDVRDARLANS